MNQMKGAQQVGSETHGGWPGENNASKGVQTLPDSRKENVRLFGSSLCY